METGLKGRTVLVTGASRNMGRLAALEFAREGANLAICTSTRVTELNEVADEARALGVEVVAARCDVTDDAAVAAFVGEVNRLGNRLEITGRSPGGQGLAAHHPRQALAFHIVHDEELLAFVHADFMDGNDVGMLQAGGEDGTGG